MKKELWLQLLESSIAVLVQNESPTQKYTRSVCGGPS